MENPTPVVTQPAAPSASPNDGAKTNNQSAGDGRILYPCGYWHSRVDFEFRFVVVGVPVILKNNKVIASIGRPCGACGKAPRRTIVSNTRVKTWMESAKTHLQSVWPFRQPLPKDIELWARFLTYVPTRRQADLSNSYEAPQDALENAGVIENDTAIKSHDGSRLFHDKERPRVEIRLRPFTESSTDDG